MRLEGLQSSNETKIRLDNLYTPRGYQRPIFDAIENKGYKKAILCWPRRCLHGDTHITMSDGSFRLLKDLKVGDSILSWNGTTFEPDMVANIWETEPKKTLTINTHAWPSIITSKDHLFAVCNCGSSVHWCTAANLKKHNQLQVYGGFDQGRLHDPDLAEFIGYMITDGYVARYQQPKFTNTNLEILKRVEYLALKIFGISAIWRKKGNGYDLGLSNGSRGGGRIQNKIKMLFRDYKLDIPKNIRPIHPLVWQFDRESFGRFIAAVISCDGSIYIHRKSIINDCVRNRSSVIEPCASISISCGNNHEYSWGLYWLLRKFGIKPHIPKFEHGGSNIKICVGKHDQIKYLLSCGIIYGKEEKQDEALNTIKYRNMNPYKLYNGCYRTYVDDVSSGCSEELYDIETTKNHNFIANGYVVHNSGKDTTLWHLILRQALRRVGVYMYCLPTYSQAKSVIWQSIRTDGLKLVDMIPEELIFKKNESNMSVELVNGSLIKLIGSDSYNTSLRGSNPMGIVFSEYAQADPDAFRACLPIIQANNGWVVIQSTPWGHNSFFDICQIAQDSPEEWFYQRLTINDTGHISEEDVENLIRTNQISREFANQEYYTSFDTGVEGSYYAKYLIKMNLNNQITDVPYEAAYPVHTAWDLGYSDMCVILFYQICNRTVHIFDMIEDNKKGLDYYCREIMAREYQYGIHVAPHDIAVTEFGSGLTRIEIARRLGIDFTICPKRSIMDGIECVRANLSRIWIDRTRCKRLVSALENYSQEWDNKMKVYKERPNHDSYSHIADALRYLCSSIDISSRQTTPEQLNERFIKAKSQSNYVETGPFARKY